MSTWAASTSGTATTVPASLDTPPAGDPPREMSLRRNFYWTFAGNAVNAACQFALICILAKLCSVDTVGIYGWAQAVGFTIVMVMILHLRGPIITDIHN